MKKRMFALTLALSLLLTSCGGGGGAKAATMHLRKTEGTVGVSDDGGQAVEPREELGLFSGYGVDTQSKSYAWIDLDDVKLVKMDQDSEIGITKEDKQLEVEVKTGSLFFNVTQPLADDETMTIRTSTMAVGIRGTCGWVTQDAAALLEGSVEVTAGEQSATISAGEMAFLTEDGKLEVRQLYVEDVPAFVAAEIGGQFPLEPTPSYSEANGLSFTRERSFTAPAFTYFKDPVSGEPTSIGGLSITNVVDATYTIGDISVSEADADGMVQMTIPYHFDFTATITQDDIYAEAEGDGMFYTACKYTLFSLFDYYTGTVFPAKTLSDDNPDLTNTIDITYKDVTYPISYTLSQETNDTYSDWDVDMGNGTAECQNAWSIDVIYTLSMPKEYDGLCLYLYLPGKTEYTKSREELSEAHTFLEDLDEEDTISDYALIRVSDLM